MSLYFSEMFDKCGRKRVRDHEEENMRANFVANTIKTFSIKLT